MGLKHLKKVFYDQDKVVEILRSKCWSCRCIIVEEAAYGNRPERNRLQMVSILEQSWKLQNESCLR